jgi:hypothetical protein
MRLPQSAREPRPLPAKGIKPHPDPSRISLSRT